MHDIETTPVKAPFKRQSLCGEDISVEEEEGLAVGSKLAMNLSGTVSGAIVMGLAHAGQGMKSKFKKISKGALWMSDTLTVAQRRGVAVSMVSKGSFGGVQQMSVTNEEEMIKLGKELYKSVIDKYSKFIADTKRKKNVPDREVAEFAWTTEVFDVMYKAADGDIGLKMAAIRFEKQCRMDFINRLLLHSNEYSAYDKGLFKFTLEF